jgi:PAS domain S-box-containing protein
MNRLKILHLEDSSSDAELVQRLLKKNSFEFDRLVVDTREEFLSALGTFAPDIILSDHSLPSFNSHEALELVKGAKMNIPFILITANVSEEFAVDVIRQGADDYILKDRLQRLPTAIQNALDKHRFKKERQEFIDNLIENEKRFRALIENSSDGIAVLSEIGKPTYVSPSIKNILGYSDQEGMNLNLLAIVHPEDLIVLEQLIQKAVANPGISFKGAPTRMVHRAGGWLWIEHVLTNMLHYSSIGGIVDNFRDITERMQSDQVMQESEEKYRSFYENSMDGILLTVTDGAILAANPAACAIFQMTEKEICLQGRMGLADKEDPRVAIAIKGRQLTGRASSQLTLIRKDGSKFPGELTSAVFMDSAGNQRTSIIVRDISTRVEAEVEALRASEEVVALNKELHNYTKELVISNTELEQFSYIISHNLRAPVANIMGLALEMKDESHTGDTKRMLNDALMVSVNLLNNVIVDLNTILKVKKEISEKKELVNFTHLVDDIKLSIKNLMATEQVEVKTDFIQANELLTLKSYIHSIFFNLISNSIKYRRAEQTPVIEISAFKKDGNLIITFRDNGIGIDMSKRKDQVFGLYNRFHQHVEGKGMGLFMVKTQVETMKGKISVESKVNEATVFTISFPIT